MKPDLASLEVDVQQVLQGAMPLIAAEQHTAVWQHVQPVCIHDHGAHCWSNPALQDLTNVELPGACWLLHFHGVLFGSSLPALLQDDLQHRHCLASPSVFSLNSHSLQPYCCKADTSDTAHLLPRRKKHIDVLQWWKLQLFVSSNIVGLVKHYVRDLSKVF